MQGCFKKRYKTPTGRWELVKGDHDRSIEVKIVETKEKNSGLWKITAKYTVTAWYAATTVFNF